VRLVAMQNVKSLNILSGVLNMNASKRFVSNSVMSEICISTMSMTSGQNTSGGMESNE